MYIYREREREREMCVYIYIYIYMYRCPPVEWEVPQGPRRETPLRVVKINSFKLDVLKVSTQQIHNAELVHCNLVI